ncbi:hypothetical protein Tco_0290072 [Tanacetum coccineum]
MPITLLLNKSSLYPSNIASMRDTYDQNKKSDSINANGSMEELSREAIVDTTCPTPKTSIVAQNKEDLEPNPHQLLIPYLSRLQEEKFQALENPTGHADHFVYRIHIVDSLCDNFYENNSLSGAIQLFF